MASGSRRSKRRKKITAPGVRWWAYVLLVLAVVVVATLVVLALTLA